MKFIVFAAIGAVIGAVAALVAFPLAPPGTEKADLIKIFAFGMAGLGLALAARR